MAPKEFRQSIFTHSDALNTYAKVRDYIEQYLINKNLWKRPQGSTFGLTKAANKVADDQGPAAMDIGAADNKGKRKGNKGKDHSGQKGKGKDSWQNSWQKPDTKGKGGKGKSDGKSKGKDEKGKEKEKGKSDGKGKEMWIKSPCRQAMSQLWEIWSHSRTMLVENRQCRRRTRQPHRLSRKDPQVGQVLRAQSMKDTVTTVWFSRSMTTTKRSLRSNSVIGADYFWWVPEHARMWQGVETLSVRSTAPKPSLYRVQGNPLKVYGKQYPHVTVGNIPGAI